MQEAKVRSEIVPVERFRYDICSSVALSCGGDTTSSTFLDVFESRCSRRTFSAVSLEQLGPLFYFSSRTKRAITNEFGLVVEKRNTPSCGAMHTLDCLVSQFGSTDWYVYNSRRHSFDKLKHYSSKFEQFKAECQKLIDCPDTAHIIWYVCDIERLGCKYENAEALALRECGALMFSQNLIAEICNLSYCALGLMGSEIAKGLSDQRDLLGVGVSVVGGRAG